MAKLEQKDHECLIDFDLREYFKEKISVSHRLWKKDIITTEEYSTEIAALNKKLKQLNLTDE